MRVLFAALALCVLSFAAGIAGDLSIAAPTPPSVILHLPPPIPANAVRAHPLPPLTTATAQAEPAVGGTWKSAPGVGSFPLRAPAK